MSAWQIPLSVEQPKFTTPLEAQTQATNLKSLAQGLRLKQQEEQENALEIAEATRQQNAQDALSHALSANTTVGDDGTLKVDHPKVLKALSDLGYGAEALKYDAARRSDITNALDAQSKDIDIHQKKAARIGSLAGAIPQVDWTETDPDKLSAQKAAVSSIAKRNLDQAISEGVIDPAVGKEIEAKLANYSPDVEKEIQSYRDGAMTVAQQAENFRAQHEEARKQILFPLQKTEAEAKAAKATTEQAAQDLSAVRSQQALEDYAKKHPELTDLPTIYSPAAIADYQRKAVPVEKQPEFDLASIEARAAQNATPEGDAALVSSVVDPKAHADLYAETMGQIADARKLGMKPAAIAGIIKGAADELGGTRKAVETAKATAPIKVNIAAAQSEARAAGQMAASGSTEDDYRRAGEQYALTGVMPPMGMGSAARGKIQHYAQEYARENGLAPKDLIQIQAAYKGDLKSLENFQKQRDQVVSFEQTAQKNLDLFLDAAAKIPDTGVPWINAPLRTLDEKAIGSANMAAVNAARQVANNEIAKVTSGGGLSGVLSDSARKEVMSYNPANATFAQTKAVANILKQDMANRHGSMDAVLGDIKSRMGTPGVKPSEYVRTAVGKDGHKIGQKADGGWYDTTTGKKVQ